MYNQTMDENAIKFGRFFKAAHWAGFIAAAAMTVYAANVARQPEPWWPLGLLAASAIAIWQAMNEDTATERTNSERRIWIAMCFMWWDATVYVSIPLLVLGGVAVDGLFITPNLLVVGFALIPAIAMIVFS